MSTFLYSSLPVARTFATHWGVGFDIGRSVAFSFAPTVLSITDGRSSSQSPERIDEQLEFSPCGMRD